MIILSFIGLWCAVSVPASLVIGRWLRHCSEERQ